MINQKNGGRTTNARAVNEVKKTTEDAARAVKYTCGNSGKKIAKSIGTGIDYNKKSPNMTVYSPFTGRKNLKN